MERSGLRQRVRLVEEQLQRAADAGVLLRLRGDAASEAQRSQLRRGFHAAVVLVEVHQSVLGAALPQRVGGLVEGAAVLPSQAAEEADAGVVVDARVAAMTPVGRV